MKRITRPRIRKARGAKKNGPIWGPDESPMKVEVGFKCPSKSADAAIKAVIAARRRQRLRRLPSFPLSSRNSERVAQSAADADDGRMWSNPAGRKLSTRKKIDERTLMTAI